MHQVALKNRLHPLVLAVPDVRADGVDFPSVESLNPGNMAVTVNFDEIGSSRDRVLGDGDDLVQVSGFASIWQNPICCWKNTNRSDQPLGASTGDQAHD